MAKNIPIAALAAALTVCTSTAATAGGWDKNEQGIDLLFDPGKIVFDANTTLSSISRIYDSYLTMRGPSSKSFDIGTDRMRGQLNLKFDPLEDTSCLAGLRMPYGLSSRYPDNWDGNYAITGKEGTVHEAALTCSYRFKVGPGYARVIGGAVAEWGIFEFFSNYYSGSYDTGLQAKLHLSDTALGWRAGVAYELPQYAARVSVMYNSQVDLNGTGHFSVGGVDQFGIHAGVSLPQSVEIQAQSGIAPGWLVMGSLKWVDWSVIQDIPIYTNVGNVNFKTIDTAYSDGWTASIGLGHQFNEQWSGTIRAAWDRGISNGFEEYADTWTVGVGARYAMNKQAELYGGLGYVFVEPTDINAIGYSAKIGWDHAVLGNVGVRLRFN